MADRTVFTSLSTPPVTGPAYMDNIAEKLGILFNSIPLPVSSIVNSGNDYTITIDPTLDGDVISGMSFYVTPNDTNTGPVRIRITTGNPYYDLKNSDGSLISVDNFSSTNVYFIVFIGGDFVILSSGLSSGGVGGSFDTQTFVADGTWVKPADTDNEALVFVEMWGAGGGGGSSTAGGGGAGGGGGYISQTFVAGDLSATEVITVGAGGSGGASGTSDDGVAGGDTVFGSHLTATGGGLGIGSNGSGGDGGDGGGGAGILGGAGGTGAFAPTQGAGGGHKGGAGGAGGPDAGGVGVDGSDAYFGGASGGTWLAVGGVSEYGGNGGNSAASGSAPGGGGGGNDLATAGGAGAPGQMIIRTVSGGGGGNGGGADWGEIGGNILNQTDLADLLINPNFVNIAELLTEVDGYTNPINVVGKRYKAGTHEYSVIGSSAVDQHITALSGLKLKLTPENNLVVALSAFGGISDGLDTTDNGPMVKTATDWLAERGGGKLVIDAAGDTSNGTPGYYIGTSVSIEANNVHIESEIPLRWGAGERFVFSGEIEEGRQDDDSLWLIRATSGNGETFPDRIYLSNADSADEFAVGEQIVIRGENDANGVALTKEIRFVTGVVTGSGVDLTTNYIVVNLALENTYETDYPLSESPADPDYTLISKLISSKMTANALIDASTVSVADGTQFAVGDFVLLQDFAVIDTIDDDGTNDTNLEGNQITEISVNDLTFASPLAHDFLTADNGVVNKMLPISGTKITGTKVQFVEEPESQNRYMFWFVYAVNCKADDIDIITLPGQEDGGGDPVGHKAHGVRIGEGCINVVANNITVNRVGYSGGGLGYGVTLYDGARFCAVTNSYFDGCRHSVLEFKGAGQNLIMGNRSVNCLNSDYDAHGGGEHNSLYIGNVAIYGPEIAADVTVKSGFRLGNPVHLTGTRAITAIGNRCYDFPDGHIAYDIQPPVNAAAMIANHAINCATMFRLRYNDRGDGNPDGAKETKVQSLTIADLSVVGNVMQKGKRFIELDGGPLKSAVLVMLQGNSVNGATNDKVQWYAVNAGSVTLIDNAMNGVINGSATDVMSFDNIDDLVVVRPTLQGGNKMMRLKDCPGAIISEPTAIGHSGQILVDEGGNDNFQFTEYKTPGQTPTFLDNVVSPGRLISRFYATPATVRDDLDLVVQTGPVDATADRVMRVPAFGLGGVAPAFTNANAQLVSGTYGIADVTVGTPNLPAAFSSGPASLLVIAGRNSSDLTQIAMSQNDHGMYTRRYRSSIFQPWKLMIANDENGDLDIDNGTIFADAGLNRVGVGTKTPSVNFEVVGTSKISSGTPLLIFDETDGTAGYSGIAFVGNADNFSIQTRDHADAFVSTDVQLIKGASGVTAHLWNIAGAQTMRLTASGLGVGVSNPSVSVHTDGPIRCASYTVATVPSASTSGTGSQIYVTDETGGATHASSDGTNWRRASDRAIIA